jgi:hypothetical protein
LTNIELKDDDEVDPLDAFMAGVQAEVEKASTAPAAPKVSINNSSF